MFSRHLFDYATPAIVAGLTLNEAFIHLKETYNAITPSFKHSSVLTPPVKCIEQKKMHSPPVPFNLPAIMSKTVPLKTTESKEQEPVLPSNSTYQVHHATQMFLKLLMNFVLLT